MVKLRTEAEIELLKQPLQRVRALLEAIKTWDFIRQSPYQTELNMRTGKVRENKNLPLTRMSPVVTAADKAKKAIVQQLIVNIETFIDSSADNIETNMESLIAARNNVETFMGEYKNYIERDPEGFEHVTEFFRTLFNYLDRFITWVRGAEQTNAETYTPGAQTLKGRYHFLSKPETKLGTALKDLEHACNNLKSDLDAHKSQENKLV